MSSTSTPLRPAPVRDTTELTFPAEWCGVSDQRKEPEGVVIRFRPKLSTTVYETEPVPLPVALEVYAAWRARARGAITLVIEGHGNITVELRRIARMDLVSS